MKEFQEYPKWLPFGEEGIIVWSKEEEEKHIQKPVETPKKRGRPRKDENQ